MARRNWTREELILAINLYCKIPFGTIHNRNPKIIKLANLINRSPNAVSYKLANFASIDPSLDRKGASHTSKLDKKVWYEFFNNWTELSYESEKILLKYKNKNIKSKIDKLSDLPDGKDKYRSTKTRINQSFFRSAILASYNNKCCITGISEKKLLIASHIIPWSVDKPNRTNPQNGLCLNAMHDKAFDCGLLTIKSEDYSIAISSAVREKYDKNENYNIFKKYDGKRIKLPERFLPNKQFLKYHNNDIFIE